MTQATNYKRSFAGSVATGMKSVFGASGRRFYELEHRTSSEKHHSGEVQKIIVDQIELGRDKNCQVHFGEDCKTVSRHHAAIIKDGNGWKLVQLSKTNSTYLNGRKIATDWYLQNGDEIQLSTGGPRLGFLVKEGAGSLVKSINLTARLSLFRQQALKPYKRALATVASILVAVVVGGIFAINGLSTELDNTQSRLADAVEHNKELEKLIAEQKGILDNQNGRLDSIAKIKQRVIVREVAQPDATRPSVDMTSCHPHVYHMTMFIALPDGKKIQFGYGTGFQLNDGKFVTARHCVHPYYSNNYYFSNNGELIVRDGVDPRMVCDELAINTMYQSGQVSIECKCVSATNSFTLSSNSVHDYGGGSDRIYTLSKSFRANNPDGSLYGEIPAGTEIRVGALGAYDYAWFSHGSGDGLVANRSLSTNIQQGTQLYILGYPHGWGKGNPILSTAMCSQSGLSKDLGGTIMASNDNSEGGNSGGPIFVRSENGWEVVAIVSGSSFAKGRFVPISVIP